MSYELQLTSHARKALKALPKEAQKRIRAKLNILCKSPRGRALDIKKLKGSIYYRLRVGDYRVIYDIIDDTLVIKVVDTGHRKNIY
jgi:mRNA interferase RelE/StbE